MRDSILPSPFERETRLREVVGHDADEAARLTSGTSSAPDREYDATDRHFGGYAFEAEAGERKAAARRTYPESAVDRGRFEHGWYLASSGAPRYRAEWSGGETVSGWLAFRERYPERVRDNDPWRMDG